MHLDPTNGHGRSHPVPQPKLGVVRVGARRMSCEKILGVVVVVVSRPHPKLAEAGSYVADNNQRV